MVSRLSGSADVRIDTPLGPEFWGVDYPTGSMPVATDGEGKTYLMGLVGELRGRIYFHDHELASEVPEPLESLQCLVESSGRSWQAFATLIPMTLSLKRYFTY